MVLFGEGYLFIIDDVLLPIYLFSILPVLFCGRKPIIVDDIIVYYSVTIGIQCVCDYYSTSIYSVIPVVFREWPSDSSIVYY